MLGLSRHVIVTLVCFAVWGVRAAPVQAQAPGQVSPEVAALYRDYPVIELVTMGIGDLIWERHGHIALCVRQPNPRDTLCYNYGIGDYAHPGKMASGFFRGDKSFWVDAQSPGQLMRIYQNADRTIWGQPLPLTPEEKAKVLAKLQFDVQEANRYYAYDHFWDNCTTRVRDILDDATGGKLRALKVESDGRTYRELARDGFIGMRIPLLITDYAMGRATDRVPSYWEKMFLPDYMREAATKAWGIEPVVLYQRQGPPPPSEGPSGRLMMTFLLLALVAPAIAGFVTRRFQRTTLWIAVAPAVFLGLVFWVLAIISPLPYVRWNETCLVLLPLDLMLVVGPEKIRRVYARGRVAMLGLIVVALAIGILKQPLWPLLPWPLVPAILVGFGDTLRDRLSRLRGQRPTTAVASA